MNVPEPFLSHCEERSDEAIQEDSTVLASLDCFVARRLLAMTGLESAAPSIALSGA